MYCVTADVRIEPKTVPMYSDTILPPCIACIVLFCESAITDILASVKETCASALLDLELH